MYGNGELLKYHEDKNLVKELSIQNIIAIRNNPELFAKFDDENKKLIDEVLMRYAIKSAKAAKHDSDLFSLEERQSTRSSNLGL